LHFLEGRNWSKFAVIKNPGLSEIPAWITERGFDVLMVVGYEKNKSSKLNGQPFREQKSNKSQCKLFFYGGVGAVQLFLIPG